MDPKRFTRRLIALGAAMFLCALVFVVTLFDAQIVNGDDYLDKYIRTTFVADLDNVQLFPEYKSLDILDLIAK